MTPRIGTLGKGNDILAFLLVPAPRSADSAARLPEHGVLGGGRAGRLGESAGDAGD